MKRKAEDLHALSAKRERTDDRDAQAVDPRIDVRIPEFADGKYGKLRELAPCVKQSLVMLVLCMNRWRADPGRGMHCWCVELRVQILTEILYGLCCYGLNVTKTIFRLATYHTTMWTHTLLGGDAALSATTGGAFVPTRWDIILPFRANRGRPWKFPEFPKGHRFATDIVCTAPRVAPTYLTKHAHPLSLTVCVFDDMSSDRVKGVKHRTDFATGKKHPYLECYCVSRAMVPTYVRRARKLGYEVNIVVIGSSRRLACAFRPILEADKKERAANRARALSAHK